MTVNYISPRSHSIAKSSGTLHMAQVGALRLAKALLESCRPLWHWYPKIYGSWINSPAVTTSPNTPASSREKRQYFSLGFGRKKTQRQRGYRSPKPFSTPKLLTVRSQYQGKNIAFFLMFVFFLKYPLHASVYNSQLEVPSLWFSKSHSYIVEEERKTGWQQLFKTGKMPFQMFSTTNSRLLLARLKSGALLTPALSQAE